MRTTLRAALAFAVLTAASPALAAYGESGVDLSLHYGWDKYDAVGLRSGLGGVDREGRLQDTSTHLGATAIFHSGMAELGVIGEIGRPNQSGSTTLLGLLAGPGFDLGLLRLELLGEVAAHRYGDLLEDAAVVSRSSSEAWLVSLGARPGLSFQVGPLLLGVWTFARWDLTSKDVRVDLSGGNVSTYRLGGAQFGASLRVGVRL